MTNLKNKELYLYYKDKHVSEGGKHPDAAAMTELIKKSIIDKTYKIYYGGGYDVNNEPILNYDVVVWFVNYLDPLFQICFDNSEGDCCTLSSSNNECKFLEHIY